jgi:hypothetical protein
MEFHGGGGYAFGNLRTSLQAGAAASTERFVIDDHTTGIGFITFPHAIHTSIGARPTMQTILLVNEHAMFRKGLALLANLLIETRSDHIQESLKLRTVFHFLDELSHFLNGEVERPGEIFLQVIEKFAMF